MGLERALDAVRGARLVLLVVDAATSPADILLQVEELALSTDQKLCVVLNKIDRLTEIEVANLQNELRKDFSAVALSAKTGLHLDTLEEWLRGSVDTGALYAEGVVVSNARHYEALQRAGEGIARVVDGLAGGISSDLLAEDVREVLYHLGTITGSVTTDEILATIFSKFCIGK
jgi:tRNA modification GTPase